MLEGLREGRPGHAKVCGESRRRRHQMLGEMCEYGRIARRESVFVRAFALVPRVTGEIHLRNGGLNQLQRLFDGHSRR